MLALYIIRGEWLRAMVHLTAAPEQDDIGVWFPGVWAEPDAREIARHILHAKAPATWMLASGRGRDQFNATLLRMHVGATDGELCLSSENMPKLITPHGFSIMQGRLKGAAINPGLPASLLRRSGNSGS